MKNEKKIIKCINTIIVPVVLSVSLNFAACGDDGASAQSETKSDSRNDQAYLNDSRDGQTYRTVAIGSQVWMAENLNYETKNSFCYDDYENDCTKYGRLYVWSAVVDKTEYECGYQHMCSLPSDNIRGVCPSGWHVPSKAEWDELFLAVGGQASAGKILKSSSRWGRNGNGTDGNGTDALGFSAFPAGYKGVDFDVSGSGSVYYGSKGVNAAFWSSTEVGENTAYNILFSFDYDNVKLYMAEKYNGFSVRCVKD